MSGLPDANTVRALARLIETERSAASAEAHLDRARRELENAEANVAQARKHLLTVNGPQGRTFYAAQGGVTHAITIPPHDSDTEYANRLLGIKIELLPVAQLSIP